MILNLSYPGQIVKAGSPATIVRDVQTQLNLLRWANLQVDGEWGPATTAAVKRFQAATTDELGHPLLIDGQLGLLSWNALFGIQSTEVRKSDHLLSQAVITTATTQLNVRENPPGSNRGKEVDAYIRSVGLDPAGRYPWCMAFVYWCFQQASSLYKLPNPAIKTAGCQDAWVKAGKAGIKRIGSAEAKNNPALIQPGQIFIMNFGGGAGHTGLVTACKGGWISTIEGNAAQNDGGREGVGVFAKTRKVSSINTGFIAYDA